MWTGAVNSSALVVVVMCLHWGLVWAGGTVVSNLSLPSVTSRKRNEAACMPAFPCSPRLLSVETLLRDFSHRCSSSMQMQDVMSLPLLVFSLLSSAFQGFRAGTTFSWTCWLVFHDSSVQYFDSVITFAFAPLSYL